MALNKSGLSAAIKAINAEAMNGDGITADEWADMMADAIDAYVKTGTVSGPITVASVSGVVTGPSVSGPGTGTLSGGTIA